MTKKRKVFKKGDWLVHPNYGLGKIRKIETKRANGTEIKYFRVEAEDTTFWVPVEGIEDSRVRKVISQSGFKRAVRLLKKPPRKMDPNYKARRKRINEVMSRGLLRPTLRLLRDLWVRNRKNKLSDTEKASFRTIMENLADEWAVAGDMTSEESNAMLTALLDQGQSQESEKQSMDPLGRKK